MISRVRAAVVGLRFLPYDVRARWVAVGPVIITTRAKYDTEGRIMFDLGRDVGAVEGPAPRRKSKSGLRVVA